MTEDSRRLREAVRNVNGRGTSEEPVDVSAFRGLASTHDPNKMGYWVECDLPVYAGIKVLFKTNNPTRRQWDRPTSVDSAELKAANRAMTRNRTTTPRTDELDDELEGLTVRVSDLLREETEGYHKRQARWLASYVLDFDPWPFEGIEKPDPADPDSYYVLATGLEDLYSWCINRGYTLALQAATKNY